MPWKIENDKLKSVGQYLTAKSHLHVTTDRKQNLIQHCCIPKHVGQLAFGPSLGSRPHGPVLTQTLNVSLVSINV